MCRVSCSPQSSHSKLGMLRAGWVRDSCWWEDTCCSVLVVLRGIDKVHSQLVAALCNRMRGGKQRSKVHRAIHDAATETMCSPGQHNKALSRTAWFEYTSEGKRRDVQPHMHLLTTSYFHSHEWGPHTDSPHFRQTVRAKTFHNTSSIQCREKLFLVFALSRTLREVCLRAARAKRASEKALARKRNGLLFSESAKPCHITFSPSCGVKVFSKQILQNCLLQNHFYFCLSVD